MSVQIISLSTGALASATGAIYTGPGTLTTIIKSIRLVNKDSVPRAVNLYIKRFAAVSPNGDTTQRYISPVNVTIPAGGLLIDDQEITLSASDVINADTNNVTAMVDYCIAGIQR
jgi:hypothetical protein